jgi:hypothetical protein
VASTDCGQITALANSAPLCSIAGFHELKTARSGTAIASVAATENHDSIETNGSGRFDGILADEQRISMAQHGMFVSSN